MIVHVGKNVFRFTRTENFYKVFEKINGEWEFIGFAKDTRTLDMFIKAVKSENKDI